MLKCLVWHHMYHGQKKSTKQCKGDPRVRPQETNITHYTAAGLGVSITASSAVGEKGESFPQFLFGIYEVYVPGIVFISGMERTRCAYRDKRHIHPCASLDADLFTQ